jgi:hypothetical protein
VEPKQRIPLINRCASTLADRGWPEIDFILSQFDLPTTDQWGGSGAGAEYDYVRDMLGRRTAKDEDIIALHDFLHGTTTHNSEEEPWKSSGLRVFITHLWSRRDDAEALKGELESWGAEAFVAHRDINPGAEWVRVIKAALYSCDALVSLLHKDFHQSDWCDQEVGVAIGRNVPVFPVNVEATPYGLLGSFQAINWKHSATNPARVLADSLVDLLLEHQQTRDRTIAALVERLVSASSYDEANKTSRKLDSAQAILSEAQIKRIVQAADDNSQVSDAWAAAAYARRLAKALRLVRLEEYGPDEAPF